MTRWGRGMSFLWGVVLALLILVGWAFSTGLVGVFVYNRF